MKTPRWRCCEGVDEQYEIEVCSDCMLVIHREGGGCWQAMLFNWGSEESPFLAFQIKASTVRGAQREAIRRTVVGLSKLVEAMSRVSIAA